MTIICTGPTALVPPPGRLVARVTRLDSFYRWRRGFGYEAGLDTQEFVARCLDPNFDSAVMERGRAFHRALELAVPGTFDYLEADGHRFMFPEEADVVIPPIRELRCGMEYPTPLGPVFVTGQVDVLDGLTVEDHKSTGYYSSETYLDGYQWRFYLDIFEADVFRWNAYEFAPYKPKGEPEPLPNVWKVSPPHILRATRYPGLHDDCVALVADYAEFVRDYFPEGASA